MNKVKQTYGTAIRSGFKYLLDNHQEVFVIGQGLWSPWYVGNTMQDLDIDYGKDRIIDTPVSESAVTGLAVGASLCGSLPIVVHPRIDFMLYAMDAVVNQAAKWSHMTGGQAHPGLTIRAIINRGGEQGAQHSQSLHSWFAHIPGLRVVMPYSVQDARDLLISSVLCPDPVVYIDDRWLYDNVEEINKSPEVDLNNFEPKSISSGNDLTIVASSYSTQLALDSKNDLNAHGINPEIIDVRVLNPLKCDLIVESVRKTRRLVVIDGGWKNSGFAAEILASVSESLEPNILKAKPLRITLPDSPAPTSKKLESIYYPDQKLITEKIKNLFT
tara:strand:- start:170 stop:1156 length:987 start_codon:yes stop_codon:yes gene_type:complete